MRLCGIRYIYIGGDLGGAVKGLKNAMEDSDAPTAKSERSSDLSLGYEAEEHSSSK
jgi:Sec-independent protein translocase protein TatA